MKISSTIKLVMTVLGFSFLTQIFGLFSSIIVARTLGPEGRGIFALFLAALLIATTLPGFMYGGVELLIAKRRKIKLNFYSIAIYSALIASVITTIFVFNLSENQLLRIFGTSGYNAKYYFIICTFAAVGYEALKKTIIAFGDIEGIQRKLFISSMITPIGVLLINTIYSIQINHLFWLILASYIYMMISMYLLLKFNITSNSYENNPSIKYYDLKNYLKDGLRYSFTTIPIGIYLKIDVIIAGSLMSVSEVGIYSIAVTITGVLMLLPRVLNMIIRSTGQDFGNDHMTVILTGKLVFLIALLASVLFFFAGNTLFSLIFGNDFSNSGTVATFLCIAFGFLGYAEVIAAYVEIKGSYSKSLAYTIWISLFFSAVTIYAACNIFGVNGIAIGLILAYIMKLTTFGYIFSRMTNIYMFDLFNPFNIFKK